MLDLGIEHRLEIGEVQLAVLRRDQDDLVDEEVDARAVRKQLLLIERIHLLLCGRDEDIGGTAVLNRLLECAAAAEVEDELRVAVLLLVHAAEFLHRVSQACRCRYLQLDRSFLRRVHLVCTVAAADATCGEECRSRKQRH